MTVLANTAEISLKDKATAYLIGPAKLISDARRFEAPPAATQLFQ
jgi:hypothetical protein